MASDARTDKRPQSAPQPGMAGTQRHPLRHAPRMTTNPHTAFVVEISRAAGAMAVAAAVVVATIAAVLMQVQPVWLQPWLPSAAEYTPPARLFTADELRLHDGRDPAKPVLIGLTTTYQFASFTYTAHCRTSAALGSSCWRCWARCLM